MGLWVWAFTLMGRANPRNRACEERPCRHRSGTSIKFRGPVAYMQTFRVQLGGAHLGSGYDDFKIAARHARALLDAGFQAFKAYHKRLFSASSAFFIWDWLTIVGINLDEILVWVLKQRIWPRMAG